MMACSGESYQADPRHKLVTILTFVHVRMVPQKYGEHVRVRITN